MCYDGPNAFNQAGKAKAKRGSPQTFPEIWVGDGLTIIPSPSVESVTTGSAVGWSRDGLRELASSRLEVPDPVLNHRQQVLESANDSLDSNDGEYEGNNGHSEESEEIEEENKLSQHEDNTDHQSDGGVQRPIVGEFFSS